MKPEIHPKYYDIKALCACGNEIEIGSTVQSISVEICEACHPFYTGQQKIVDTEGRVEKFKKRFEGKKVAGNSETRAGSRQMQHVLKEKEKEKERQAQEKAAAEERKKQKEKARAMAEAKKKKDQELREAAEKAAQAEQAKKAAVEAAAVEPTSSEAPAATSPEASPEATPDA